MTILLDTPVSYGKGKIVAHMVSDDSLEELHDFAKKLGIRRDLFHVTGSGFARYHINIPKRLRALELGAKESGPGQFMKASRDLSRL